MRRPRACFDRVWRAGVHSPIRVFRLSSEIVLTTLIVQAHTYTLSYEASTTILGVEYSYPQQVSVGAGERKNVTVIKRY